MTPARAAAPTLYSAMNLALGGSVAPLRRAFPLLWLEWKLKLRASPRGNVTLRYRQGEDEYV